MKKRMCIGRNRETREVHVFSEGMTLGETEAYSNLALGYGCSEGVFCGNPSSILEGLESLPGKRSNWEFLHPTDMEEVNRDVLEYLVRLPESDFKEITKGDRKVKHILKFYDYCMADN